jgi:hypothetical protein
MWVSRCGFGATLPHHMTVLECVNSFPKIMLGAGFVADVALQFPGLQFHLTSLLSMNL